MRIREEDRMKAAFVTPFGVFKPLRMKFGFKNAPPAFQRIMVKIFSEIAEVFAYLDDINAASVTEEEHLVTIGKVLAQFEK